MLQREGTPIGAEEGSDDTAGPRAALAALEGLSQPRTEHHALKQRVRGEAIRAVHPDIGDLSCGPEPIELGGAVDVGQHTTSQVVCRRSDWQPLCRRIEASRGQLSSDGGEAFIEALQAGGVQPAVLGPICCHDADHRPRDHVSRGELIDEPLTRRIAQHRTVTAERL